MMIGKTKSVRDRRDPLMRQFVESSRPLLRQPRRIGAKGQVLPLAYVGGATPVLYACNKCGTVYGGNSYIGTKDARHEAARAAAARCCDPRCRDCGRALKGRYSAIDESAFRAICDVDERGLPDLRWDWEPPQMREARLVQNSVPA